MQARKVNRIIPAQDTSDGAGVKLRLSLGRNQGARHDPLLMLDEFYSDDPADYLAGFPAHPHRGFETVTYMLDGHLLHEDHLGNRGDLKAGGVQWMRAGRGIIHSEMPQQNQGRMRGFQLWINLPASEKMSAPWYRDIRAEEIPTYSLGNGSELKLIAGRWQETTCEGPASLSGADTHTAQAGAASEASAATQPIYADLRLATHPRLTLALPASHNVLVYVYEGAVNIAEQTVTSGHAALLGDGEQLQLDGDGPSKLLLIAGRPLNEPVVQYGPFVMNTADEIEQALHDYREGRLTA